MCINSETIKVVKIVIEIGTIVYIWRKETGNIEKSIIDKVAK